MQSGSRFLGWRRWPIRRVTFRLRQGFAERSRSSAVDASGVKPATVVPLSFRRLGALDRARAHARALARVAARDEAGVFGIQRDLSRWRGTKEDMQKNQ